MLEIVTWLSMACATSAVGYLVAVLRELSLGRKDLKQSVKEFDEVTKKASDANISMADKLLQMDERLASLEFKVTAQTVSQNSGWKAR